MEESIYGDSKVLIEMSIKELLYRINDIRKSQISTGKNDPVQYAISRVKTSKSMTGKLERKGIKVSKENALNKVYDAAGIRLICPYISDVYTVVELIKKQKDLIIFKEKDYIKFPKENGYRSYHLIVKVPVNNQNELKMMYVEIQIRTIAEDCWASLEHELKYKKNISNSEIIIEELKNCADNIATVDINMQSIKDMINQN